MGKVLDQLILYVADVDDLPEDNSASKEGRICFVNDSPRQCYRDNGTTWDLVMEEGTGGGSGSVITAGGAYSDSRPGSPVNGDMYIATDSRFIEIYHDSAWNRYFDGQLMSNPPSVGSFTEINMSPATFTDDKGELLIDAPPSAGTNVHAALVSASAPYKLTVLVEVEMIIVAEYAMGLCLRESGSSSLIGCGPGGTGSAGLFRYMTYDDETTFNVDDPCWTQQAYPSHRLWLQIENNSSNRRWRWSTNGRTWFDMHGEGPTDFITEDQVGIFIDVDNPDVGARLRVLSWKLE